jgi:4-amino-4-deoxy-L-arabinose transferase-like glycosyltransferase
VASRWRDFSTPAVVGVCALTALAAVLRFYGLDHQGFWFDEANTALLVHFSPGKMLGLIPQSESTPPLYYCVAWVWSRLFGDGEAGLRSLSALAGVLVVPVTYATGTKLMSQRAGMIAAALVACNPFLIWYSQEARSYELLVLLTSLALLAFVYARAAPYGWILAAWVVASALSLATHYYAVLAIVPQALWLLFEHRRSRSVQIAFALVAICGLALIPLAISQNATGHATWIAHSSLRLRLAQIIPQFLIGTGAPARKPLKWIAFVLVLGALALLVLRANREERRPALIAGGLALGGFVVNLLLIAGGVDDLITRNIIAILVPAILLVASGMAVRRARVLGAVLAVALCTIGVAAAVGVAAERNLQRPDWRAVAFVLGNRPRPGSPDRAILVQHYRTLLPLSLYMPQLKFLRARNAVVDELDVISISSPQQPLCWWGAACNLIPSQMQRTYNVPGFHVLWRRRALQFTIMRLVSDRPVTVTPRAVAAALRTTKLPHDELLIQRPR